MRPAPNGTLAASLCLLLAAACLSIGASGEPLQAGAPEMQFERIGPFGGEVRSILWSTHNPANAWLGTSDGQLYQSRNGGRSWRHVHPGIGRRAYVVDTLVEHPVTSGRIFAGAWDRQTTGGGLFESRDGGAVWRRLDIPEPRASIRGFAICRGRPERMIAGTLGGLYRSRDDGRTWEKANSPEGSEPLNIESVAIDPSDPDRIYVGTWRLGYASTDFGRTWKRMDRGMIFDSDVFSIAVHPNQREVVYASACTGIYRSDDRALTWRRFQPFPGRSVVRTHIVYIDPLRPRRIYAGTTEGLLVSNDAGGTWSRVTPASWTINAIQVNPASGAEIMLGTGLEGVMRSADGGRTWQPSNKGFSHHHVKGLFRDPAEPGRYFVLVTSAGDQSGIFRYDNHRNEWSRVGIGAAEGGMIRVLMTVPGRNLLLAATHRGPLQWSAATGRWTKFGGALTKLGVSDFAFEPKGRLIFAGTSQGVYRAAADRLVFEMPGPPFLPEIYSLSLRHDPDPVLYAACSLGVARSSDLGVTWKVISAGLPLSGRVRTVTVNPADPRHILAGTAQGLFESRDDGASWKAGLNPMLRGDIASVMFLDATGRFLAAAGSQGNGIVVSRDAGAHWERLSSPAYDSPVLEIAHDPASPGMLYLGTQSDGVYRLRPAAK